MFYPEEWGNQLAANDQRSLHMREILKLRVGDQVRVGLVGTGIGFALVEDAGSEQEAPRLAFPPVDELVAGNKGELVLIIGHPRPPVFQRLLKDLSTLGVGSIHWVLTELGEKSYLASKAWRADSLQRQIRLGLEQGGRCHPPEIHKHYRLEGFLKDWNDRLPRRRIILDENSRSVGLPHLIPPGPQEPLVIAIGPERGWTAEEAALLVRNGFSRAGLGPSIVRTETAAVLAAGLWSMSTENTPDQVSDEAWV